MAAPLLPAPQLVAPGIAAILQIPVYDPINGQWYQAGEELQFATADQLYAFLESVPQCVQTDVPYPFIGVQVVYVSQGYGCAPVNTCPCATAPLY